MKLSIGMMVKNESKHLRECLESLKPIRDAIESELIIVDTGSTDNTVEIAKEFTDKVYFHEWNSDFSEIRNTTIKYCTGEWFFCIDGDEVISNPDGILQFFNSNEIKKYKTASITIKNFTSIDTNQEFTIFNAVRIFKKDKDFRFEGAIHNQPIWKNPMIKLNSEILHYGYINNDKELMDKKFLRTSEILKSELEKDPENIYYIYQLSVSYAMHGDRQEALEIIKKAYNLVKAKKLNLNKYMYVSIFLSRIYLDSGNFKEVEAICLEATKQGGFYIDLYYYLAKAQFSIYKNEEAIETYNIYFKKLEDFNNFKVVGDLAIIDYTIGNHDEACLDMAILYERLDKYEEALRFIRKIKSHRVLNHSFNISISVHAKLNKFEELRDFYYDICGNHNIIKNYFINALELYLLNEDIKTRESIFKIFSEGDTEYALLNKLRLNSDNVYDLLNEEINELDFSNLPDYFGDILYYFLCKKISLVEYLKNVNDFKIRSYCNYLALRHKNLGMNLYNYLNNYKNTDLNIDEIRIYKILSVYLLQDKNINNEKYSEILDRYLEIGEEYLTRIYNDDIIQGEFTNCMKDEDDMFLMYIHLANKNKNSEVLYIRYLRKALNACNYMKKGIDILSERLKENLKQKDNEMNLYKIKVKKNITELIEGSSLEEAKILIDEYENIIKDDFEIYSMKAVVAIMENRLEDSKDILIAALDKFNDNFDLNYNLGYVYEKIGEFSFALKYYKQALENCKDEELKLSIRNLIQEISNENNIVSMDNREKIVFFVKQGMDSFLGDIINGLSDIYETKKIVVTDYKQIDEGMEWADICWFEWCDELIAYGSKLDLYKEKKIICRLHRYEAFNNYINNVQWDSVDKLIFVSEHIKDILINKIKIDQDKCEVVYNGINLDKFKFYEREKGFNLAWIGYINLRKNPMIVIQYLNELVKIDKRYKLYIAGSFQDETLYYYLNDIIDKLGLKNNIQFDGFIPNDKMSKWLKDKNYILTGSIAEGHPVGVMEAMASGIKPVIHYFPGVEGFYPREYIYYNLDDFIRNITEKNYDSNEYYKYINDNFSLERQRNSIMNILTKLEGNTENDITMIKDLPLVSICIPVYNGEKYIRYTIESVLNQTYKNLEIIICDNCSTDNTVEIIKSYNDGRIRLYKNESNIGIRCNANKCIGLSKGKYIKYIFADDILLKDCIQEMVDVMEENPDVNLSGVNFTNIDESNNIISKPILSMASGKYKSNYIFKRLIIEGNIIGSPSAVMIRKEALKITGLFTNLKLEYMGDYDLWIMLCKIGNYYFINKEHMRFRIHTQSITGQQISKIKRVSDFYYILNKYIDNVDFTETEIRNAYENANRRSYYSLNTNNDLNEKLEILQFILKNSKYIPRSEKIELLNLKAQLITEMREIDG